MKKNYIVIPSLISLFLLLFSNSIFATLGTVSVDNLNIRSGPGTEYDVIGQAHQNSEVTIIDEAGEWYKIQFGQVEGWASKEFVHQSPSSLNTNYEAYVQIGVPKVTINIKDKPSLDGKVIDQIVSGESYPLIKEENSWYQIQLPSGDTGWVAKWLVKKFENQNDEKNALKTENEDIEILRNKIIIIDAGHGGDDTGTISASGDYEKYLTLQTGQMLANKLESLGAIVIPTRTGDQYLPLENRVAYAHAYQADAFVSLHYNSAPEFPTVHGIGTFYYHDQFYPLANEVQKEIIQATNFKDREARFGDYFVVRENTRPGILVELGFLSNVQEEKTVNSDTFQQQATNGIIRGLVNYFEMLD